MILYLPERLYDELKDNKEYQAIDKEMTAIHEKFTTLEEWVTANPRNNPQILSIYNKLTALVKKVFSNKPQYIEEYNINNGIYTALEMKQKLYTDQYDTENKFYLLSNIINQSFDTHNFQPFLKAYISLYESLDEETKDTLSKYIHLKYMHAKVFVTTMESDLKDIDSLPDQFKTLYLTISNRVQDKDITLNYFIESLNNSVGLLLDKSTSKKDYLKILDYMSNMGLWFDAKAFQYEECALSILRFMDIKNSIYINCRDYTSAYHVTYMICRRIGDALEDMHTTLRGLGYYDKCNHNIFGLMIRKYIKLTDYVPMLEPMNQLFLPYLSDADKEYVMSDRIGVKESASNPNKIIDTYVVEDIDRWFTDNEALEDMKDINVGV